MNACRATSRTETISPAEQIADPASLPVAGIGSGPVGLAAAARRQETVFEASASAITYPPNRGLLATGYGPKR